VGTTLAIRFPLGRYHANPWDRAVNEGESEWPPSLWRLLRALVATWHTRWPDLPTAVLEGLLDDLGEPPSYRTPEALPGHTRHYLPDLNHRKGETGRTDLTLDPFLSVRPDDDLLVRWDVELHGERKEALAKLAELIPYLGRSESLCEARLLDTDPVPDETWWRPDEEGARRVRLLAPVRPVDRSTLEATTTAIRKSRRTVPPGTVWISYAAAEAQPHKSRPRQVATEVDAVRFAVMSRAPVKLTHGVLLADAVHAKATREFPDDISRHVIGYRGATTDHRHAHWIPLPGQRPGERERVRSLVIYVPNRLMADDVSRLIGIREVSGQVGGAGGNGYEFRDLPRVELLLQAAGTVSQVAPELCGPSRRWRSLTPYIPVRHWHRKREAIADYLTADVTAELAYRNWPAAVVRQSDPGSGLPDGWARGFRRYRMKEHLGKARPGLRLALEFPDEVPGPLLLGQLSHFGYGIFVPDEET
jgi:CRISPR-associated protein Csb2